MPYKHTVKGRGGCYDEISYGNTAIYADLNDISPAEANFTLWQEIAMPAIAGIDKTITLADYTDAVAVYEALLTERTLKEVLSKAFYPESPI